MAYLIHMRTIPSEGGEATPLRVLSDADTLDEALTEALAAVRERYGNRHATVERQQRCDYAPTGDPESMPDHDLYASRPEPRATVERLTTPWEDRPLCDNCSHDVAYGEVVTPNARLYACAACLVHGKIEELPA